MFYVVESYGLQAAKSMIVHVLASRCLGLEPRGFHTLHTKQRDEIRRLKRLPHKPETGERQAGRDVTIIWGITNHVPPAVAFSSTHASGINRPWIVFGYLSNPKVNITTAITSFEVASWHQEIEPWNDFHYHTHPRVLHAYLPKLNLLYKRLIFTPFRAYL